jgi:glycosyltransferase involved in cell wall biosynthesis
MIISLAVYHRSQQGRRPPLRLDFGRTKRLRAPEQLSFRNRLAQKCSIEVLSEPVENYLRTLFPRFSLEGYKWQWKTTTWRVSSLKVSTIIPVYNGDRTVASAIDSALAQNYDEHEVIVVNDGSTDSTAAILGGYGERIKVVTQPNGGLSVARNAGVRHSTGKYLALLDADDIWLEGKLKTMIPALEQNSRASLVFSECRYINNDGVELGGSSLGHAPSLDESLMPRPFVILPSTWVLRWETLDRVGGFCEEFKGSGGFDDTWLLMLLRELGEFVYVSEDLTLYRWAEDEGGDDKVIKFEPGMLVLISLLKERYGTRAREWIRNTKSLQCRALRYRAGRLMSNGDRQGP